VVVGATPEELDRAGYLPVGREFPVFLHPETHEEYALARLERKVAPGYRGFTTQASPEVTLEEDLRRRDLTINAMAESPGGEIIDPYGGQADLAARVLRHVSDAFVEDPVRILRVARFAAVHGVPQPPRWHPEIDTGVHVLLAVRTAAQLGASNAVRFAALTHDLGKARTPRERWPSHHGHEAAGVPLIEALCARLKVPNAYRELAVLAARHHTLVHRAAELKPATVLTLLEDCDAFRRSERFAELLLACEAD